MRIDSNNDALSSMIQIEIDKWEKENLFQDQIHNKVQVLVDNKDLWNRLEIKSFDKIFENATRSLLLGDKNLSNERLWSFIIISFNSFHHPSIRSVLSRYVFDGLFLCLADGRAEMEFTERMSPALATTMRQTMEKLAHLLSKNSSLEWQQTFLSKLTLRVIEETLSNSNSSHSCFLSFQMNSLLKILLNQRISRRLLVTLLLDHQYQDTAIIKLLNIPFDNYSMDTIGMDEFKARLYERISNMQKRILNINDKIAFSSFGTIANEMKFRKILEEQDDNVLIKISQSLCMRWFTRDRFINQMLIEYTCNPRMSSINMELGSKTENNVKWEGGRSNIPILPTENNLKMVDGNGMSPIVTFPNEFPTWPVYFDYLIADYQNSIWRAIRDDIEEAIYKCQPVFTNQLKKVEFDGWSRMALPLNSSSIKRVEGEDLLEKCRSEKITMEVVWDLGTYSKDVKSEWDTMKEGDVLFLIRFNQKNVFSGEHATTFEQYGVETVRGVRFLELTKKKRATTSEYRIVQLALDPIQYELDIKNKIHMDNFHLIIKRQSKENNFFPVLKSLVSCPLPCFDSLEGPILGFETIDNNFFNIFIGNDYIEKAAELIRNDFLNTIKGEERGIEEEKWIKRESRTFVISRSNNSLDELLDYLPMANHDHPIMNRLVRLGFSEKKYRNTIGRLDYHIKRKEELLKQVDKLVECLGIVNEYAHCCEASHFFYLKHIKPRCDAYKELLDKFDILNDGMENLDLANLLEMYPFKEFSFENQDNKLDKESDWKKGIDSIDALREIIMMEYSKIETIFNDLHDLWPLELLPMEEQVQSYLACNYSRLIMMTATLFAIKYDKFKEELEFDNLIILDAHCIGEQLLILPITLIKKPVKIFMLGSNITSDNLSLPSMMNRLKISNPITWLSESKDNLTTIIEQIETKVEGKDQKDDEEKEKMENQSIIKAPKGMSFAYQFIHVGLYEGKRETQPIPTIIQNIGEAEYVISLFQYLRFHDHQVGSISILTPYRGQLNLIRDIWEKRCTGWTDWFDKPKMATLDEFSGRKNDIIILSLVRTKSRGFMTESKIIDVLNSARKAIYIFGDCKLWSLIPTLSTIMKKNQTRLSLHEEEFTRVIEDVIEMGQMIYEKCMERKEEIKIDKYQPTNN